MREDGGSNPELLKSEGPRSIRIHCCNEKTIKQDRSVTKYQLLFPVKWIVIDFKHSRRELTQDWRCGRKATLPISKCSLACFPLRFYFCYACSSLFSILFLSNFKFLPLMRYFPLFRLRCRSAEPSPREAMAHKESGHTSSP